MKEVKAYVRPSCLDVMIAELEKAGAKDITIIRVDALGALVDYQNEKEHKWIRKYEEKYSATAKIEIVCKDEQAGIFTEIIKKMCHTGLKGDGRVFISNIEDAVNIRDGSRGEAAL